MQRKWISGLLALALTLATLIVMPAPRIVAANYSIANDLPQAAGDWRTVGMWQYLPENRWRISAGPLAAISFSGSYGPENFDTLASSGTSSTVPNGWEFSESGSNANTTYTAGTGSLATGDTYSFGATGSSERAFGGLQSGSLIPTIGVQFQNNTGQYITTLTVEYDCEQWRLGATGRGADRLDFQYSTDATSLTTGTWTDVNALDCSSAVTTGTPGALDGNASANRTAISGSITSLSIANGSNFWLRWNDFNVTNSDDGLAVDNFEIPSSALAAALADFNAAAFGDHILVTWETVSEIGNLGFNLWRGVSPNAPDVQLNASLIPSQAPGSSQGFSYEWPDSANLVNTTTYYYWLEDVDIAGVVTRHGPISATYSAPTAVSLSGFAPVSALPVAWPLAAAGLTALAAAAVAWRRR